MAATKGAFVLWYCSHRAIRLVLVKSKMRAGESIRDWGEVQLSFTQPWNVQPLERVLTDIYESPKFLVTVFLQLQVEVVSTSGTGSSRLVRRIGKNRRVHEADMAGEFAGFLCSKMLGSWSVKR